MIFYFGKYTGVLQFGDPPEEEKKRNVDDSDNFMDRCPIGVYRDFYFYKDEVELIDDITYTV